LCAEFVSRHYDVLLDQHLVERQRYVCVDASVVVLLSDLYDVPTCALLDLLYALHDGEECRTLVVLLYAFSCCLVAFR